AATSRMMWMLSASSRSRWLRTLGVKSVCPDPGTASSAAALSVVITDQYGIGFDARRLGAQRIGCESRFTADERLGAKLDLNDTPEQAEYREKVRGWLGEDKGEAPPRSGSSEDSGYIDARRAWQRKLAEAGLAGVTWPREYGGQGLGPIEQVITNQEIGRADVPGILDAIGVGMLGPTIIANGDDEQKSRYLGPMLHGDEVWCQLFSEPAAGSDLAGIQSRARQQDDGSWLLSGQKVWTTNAQFASYGLLLARTDPDVPKHKGLTMFIVPIQDAEGVTV